MVLGISVLDNTTIQQYATSSVIPTQTPAPSQYHCTHSLQPHNHTPPTPPRHPIQLSQSPLHKLPPLPPQHLTITIFHSTKNFSPSHYSKSNPQQQNLTLKSCLLAGKETITSFIAGGAPHPGKSNFNLSTTIREEEAEAEAEAQVEAHKVGRFLEHSACDSG